MGCLTGFPRIIKQVGLDNRKAFSVSSSSNISAKGLTCFFFCEAINSLSEKKNQLIYVIPDIVVSPYRR